ncbi:RcnB family protein [Croceicoccus naphthovorans]|uniref:RcnB family protein n=1 Tax=Croceicoccus naphthovorans TaxID=1348774 RepID=UPI000A51FC78|nr:RcnB family protein [Croceicoccus naphthovorans]MBB3989370.1 Ni/Co efflux regulator RcnB [Croceicoccus naphthovorans]
MKTFTKNIVAGAVATAMLLPAVPAMAKHRDHDRYEHSYRDNDRHDSRYDRRDSRSYRGDNHGKYVSRAAHKWRKGERFDRRYARDYRVVSYRDYRGLRAPPRGYHYVRSGNDVLLVGITSGIIGAVIGNMIR